MPRSRWQKLRALLPEGIPLPDEAWSRRHRAILAIVWLQAAAVPLFSLVRGHGLWHGVGEAALIAVPGLAATRPIAGGRRLRGMAAAIALLTTSGVFVHLSGGLIEMHFHFFVMVAVITLYQDWTTFLAAILFVGAHHGVMGYLQAQDVFDHQAAWNNPLKWSLIHAGFILAASAAQLASWRFVEDQYRRAESEITARERRFRSLIENSSDGITVLGPDGTVLYDSPSVATLMGYPTGSREGGYGLAEVHPDDVARTTALLSELAASPAGATLSLEARARHQDGDYRWIEANATNLLGDETIGGIVANFRDVTHRKLLESELSHQAFHDPLTGLANRALFLDRVEHAMASQHRTGGLIALLYLDIDDFKTINDALGHGAGDEVLVIAAERLTTCLRDGDTCARLGGDEFAILLEGLEQPGTAYEVGARIIEELAEPLTVQGSRVSIAASLGIVLTGDGEDAESLVRNADLAMYRAKTEGKGRYEIFERGMHDAVVERLELKADLRRAVEHAEMVAHYQPIVDLNTGAVIGAEALVRWHHPERGWLAPGAFIDLAEETGLIVPIGRRVLEQACQEAAGWQRRSGRPISVSVNLSPKQLLDNEVVIDVRAILARTGLDPALLTLEITEGVLIADPNAASRRLTALKGLGVKLALDDFGTGYSSLSYLGRFPVDSLKIDKSFVDSLGSGARAGDAKLVNAITGIADLLGLEVTAEGIEEATQVPSLLALGCRLGQGYLFARPVPHDELVGLFDQPLGPRPVRSEPAPRRHSGLPRRTSNAS